MIAKSNFRKWKWRFTRKHVCLLPFDLGPLSLTILSGTGNALVVGKGDKLTINKHYHFDGATCAPDFKKVLRAAALHDALLQLKQKYPGKISERMAHQAFRREMRADGFRLWPIYSFFTRPFSRAIYKRLTKGKA